MKILILSVSTALALATLVSAAPVESVAANQATSAKQTIDRFLGQEVVTQQLQALGVSRAQIDARLAKLSDAELQAVAAEIELLQAGGTIQDGNLNRSGPIRCIVEPIGRFLHNLYQLVFCWGKFE